MSKVHLIDENADFQYLEGIRRKDHQSFAGLYRKYFQGLVLASDKYLKEIDVAKEIVQDVFLKMWEHPFEIDHNASLKSYLYRTVINYSLNHLKREKNITEHHLKIAGKLQPDSLDAIQEEQELKILIYNEIELLPAQCKKVFKMSRFEGLKYREIAIALNISEKTVENHMIKALKILRERLYEQNNNNIQRLKMYSILFITGSSIAGLIDFGTNNTTYY